MSVPSPDEKRVRRGASSQSLKKYTCYRNSNQLSKVMKAATHLHVQLCLKRSKPNYNTEISKLSYDRVIS